VKANPTPTPRPRPATGWGPQPGFWARSDGELVLLLGPSPGPESAWDGVLQDGRIGRFPSLGLAPVVAPAPGEWWTLSHCLIHNPGHTWGTLPILVPARSKWWCDPGREDMVRCGCLSPDESEHPQ
jgi:hypothetical protein